MKASQKLSEYLYGNQMYFWCTDSVAGLDEGGRLKIMIGVSTGHYGPKTDLKGDRNVEATD